MRGLGYTPASLMEWALSSAGEHYLDMVGVTGSIPVAPTIPSTKKAPDVSGAFLFLARSLRGDQTFDLGDDFTQMHRLFEDLGIG